MFIMDSKWFTFWTLEYTILWIFINKITSSNRFMKLINPLYLLMIIAYGYLLIVFYQLMVNKTQYELSFLLSNILFHFAPLVLFQRYFDGKGNLLFTGLFIMLYLGYITQQNKNLYDIYLTEIHIKSFKDLYRIFK